MRLLNIEKLDGLTSGSFESIIAMIREYMATSLPDLHLLSTKVDTFIASDGEKMFTYGYSIGEGVLQVEAKSVDTVFIEGFELGLRQLEVERAFNEALERCDYDRTIDLASDMKTMRMYAGDDFWIDRVLLFFEQSPVVNKYDDLTEAVFSARAERLKVFAGNTKPSFLTLRDDVVEMVSSGERRGALALLREHYDFFASKLLAQMSNQDRIAVIESIGSFVINLESYWSLINESKAGQALVEISDTMQSLHESLSNTEVSDERVE